MIVLLVILMSIFASYERSLLPGCTYRNFGSGEHYICSNNYIRKQKQTFPRNINFLHLDNTSINELESGAFDLLDRLLLLNLSRNSITKLPVNIFDKTVKLENLDLSYNKIENLHNYLFNNLINLHILDLRNNRIRMLPDQIFRMLGDLDELNLSFNKIVTLHEKTLKPLSKLDNLVLNGNEFTCDCDLYGVKKWVERRHLRVDVICENPGNKSFVQWSNVTFMESYCLKTMIMYNADEKSSPTQRSTIITVSVVLVIFCVCVILAVFWWRNKSRRNYSNQPHKLKDISAINASEGNITVDLDQMYAKVNKNRKDKGDKNVALQEERPQSVGFYTSLKEHSLYCEVVPESTLRFGDEHGKTDSQTLQINSIYESSGQSACVKENPS